MIIRIRVITHILNNYDNNMTPTITKKSINERFLASNKFTNKPIPDMQNICQTVRILKILQTTTIVITQQQTLKASQKLQQFLIFPI